MWHRFLEWFDFSALSKFFVLFRLMLLLMAYVVVVFVLMKFSWAWIIPKIFPNMVKEGWLPESLTLFQLFKLMLFFCFLKLGSCNKNLKIIWREFFENQVMRLVVDLLISVIFWIITGFLVFISWNWVISDVFSNAVIYGLVPSYLSVWDSILLVFLLWLIGITGRNIVNIFEDKK